MCWDESYKLASCIFNRITRMILGYRVHDFCCSWDGVKADNIWIHDVRYSYFSCLKRCMLWQDRDSFNRDCLLVKWRLECAAHDASHHHCHKHREEDIDRCRRFEHNNSKRIRHTTVTWQHGAHSKKDWRDCFTIWLLVNWEYLLLDLFIGGTHCTANNDTWKEESGWDPNTICGDSEHIPY